MSSTLGYTSVPSSGTFSHTVSATNAVAMQATMPGGGGAPFSITAHFRAFDSGTHTAYFCYWNSSGTLLVSVAKVISGGEQTYTAAIPSPAAVGGGSVLYIGFQIDSTGYTVEHDNTGTSYAGTSSSGPPTNISFGASGFGVVQAYLTYNTAPTISNFSPTVGIAGTTQVVITGTEYSSVTSVTFNGVAASYSIDSDSQITATVPTSATSGPIVVTNPMGSATSSTFTVSQAYADNGAAWVQGVTLQGDNGGSWASTGVQVWADNGSAWVQIG